MRTIVLSIAACGALALTGCTSLVSLNPVATDADSFQDPALAGTWGDESGDDTFLIRAESGGKYDVKYVSKDESQRFEGRLMRIGEARILDLAPKEERAFYIAAHALVRVWPEAGTLRYAFLDSDWLKDQLARQSVSAQTIGEQLVVTARTEGMRAALLKVAGDDRACGKVQVLARVAAGN